MSLRPTTLDAERVTRLALGAGVAIRVVYWLSKWNTPLGLNDSIYYGGQASQLIRGRFFRELFVDIPGAEHGPLTSILMAPFSFGDDRARWQRLVTLACGITLVWVLSRLGARLGGARLGAITAVIAAVAPNLWMNDGLVMSESVSMLLAATTVWLALIASSTWRRRDLVLLGVAAGLGALARSELVLLIPLVLVWLLICRRREGLPPWPAALRVAVVAGLVLAPWVLFNLARFERPVFLTTNDGTTLLGANCPMSYTGTDRGGWALNCVVADPDYRVDEDRSVRSARQRSMAIEFVRDHTSEVPVVVMARLGRTLDLYGLSNLVYQDVGEERPRWAAWLGVLTFWVMAVLSVIGWRALPRRQRWLLTLPILVTLCTTVLFYGGHRIRSSAEPSLVLLTAVAVHHLLASRRRRLPSHPVNSLEMRS
ncbi:MAG: glycosyltransferase family 39 protein [Ilumatobacteraceae bacterium]